MKTALVLFVSCFVSSAVYSQEIPKLNNGVGYPFIIPGSGNTVGELYADGTTFNIFADKPFFSGLKKARIYCLPGYFVLAFGRTRYDRGGLASDEHGEYIRNAFSIYSKLLCNLNLNRIGKHNWNFGVITGYYLYTHVDGIFEWTFLQDGPDYHGSNKFDGDDKDFFKSFYFGFVSDFQFNFKKVRFLKPAIELSFYPNYANIAADYYIDNDIKANRSMIMGSIILGPGSKKLSNKIEK